MHGTFTVSATYEAPPERVFAAFADEQLRRKWFRLPGESGGGHHELDFRVGGTEVARSTFAVADVTEHLEYRSRFIDIVPGERIVLSYEFLLDAVRRWVSLVTVELTPAPTGTLLTWTEQYTYLVLTADGNDTAHLQGGTRLLLNGLPRALDPI
ncbi:SRPBCC domain-containing protein [Streptomyces sp. KK5PA1]|uniref:SRPBCC domain-containing protein n=1 Tax=Actinacidiphila acididurans TaxID=2784346 RepID=A0ABS2U1I5_9ACTN|nr:SRPBCC domain-containing protein [Actinacidiphila acididurans]